MSTKHVYKAISQVMAQLSKYGIDKTRLNPQQNYRFRGVDDIYNALSPILSNHNLCILPRMIDRSTTERTTRGGGVLFYVVVTAEFDFISVEDGSIHTVRLYGEAMDTSDKATNKAMSAAYKYAMLQTFCIPVEGEDADATTYHVEPRQPDHETISAAQHKRLEAMINELELDREAVKAWIKTKFGIDHFPELNRAQYERLNGILKRKSEMKGADHE